MANSSYSQVDEYGFERSEDCDIYKTFQSNYMTVLTRRAQRWNAMFRNSNLKKSNTLKRFVRKGVPAEFRATCWMVTSGAELKRSKSTQTYQELKLQNRNAQIIDAIKIDLPRTFPDNIFFLEQGKLPKMLYDVLATFAHQNTEVGYCQGLNYIAGLILLVTKDEAITFWLLKTLVEDILPKYYIITMTGLITDLDVLNEFVKRVEPAVHRHIQHIGMPWAMGATKWFICLYADVLPTETVLRIWDCLLYDGSKVLIRVALTLIQLHREPILQATDLSELMTVFKNMKNHPKVVDCHHFIKDVYTLSRNISSSRIDKLRIQYKKN